MILLETLEYPKVLVIDPTPFNRTRNNGIVKSNLFQGWPKDRLAQIDYSIIRPDFDVCNRYWKLTKTDILKGIINSGGDGAVPVPERGLIEERELQDSLEYESRPAIERLLSILPLNLRLLIGEAIFRLPSLLSGPLRAWIEDFQPDVLYSITANAPMLRTVVKVSEWRNIPIVPFFTDDWVTTLYRDHPLGKWLRRSLIYWFDRCLKRSPVRMTICDAMKEEYSRRYGGTFETILYPIDGDAVEGRRRPSGSKQSIRFLFIGSVEPERWQSLHAIGEALYQLRSEGVRGELLIYAFPEEIRRYHDFLTLEPTMRVMGTARPEDVRRLQCEADVLVHVESFGAKSREYTKYSLSTKIPQYMMAGACIFAFGPGEVASIRYIEEARAGMVVGNEDPSHLIKALRTVITDDALRFELGNNARLVAMKRHDPALQREHFRRIISEATSLWKN